MQSRFATPDVLEELNRPRRPRILERPVKVQPKPLPRRALYVALLALFALSLLGPILNAWRQRDAVRARTKAIPASVAPQPPKPAYARSRSLCEPVAPDTPCAQSSPCEATTAKSGADSSARVADRRDSGRYDAVRASGKSHLQRAARIREHAAGRRELDR